MRKDSLLIITSEMEILNGIFSFPGKCYQKIIKSGVRDYNKTLHSLDFIFTKVILEL